ERDLLARPVGVEEGALHRPARRELREAEQAQPIAGADPLVVGRITEAEREDALLLQVRFVDAREALRDDRGAAEPARGEGGVLAAAALAVVRVADDRPADAAGPMGARGL